MKRMILTIVVVLSMVAATAHALSYGFSEITNMSTINVAQQLKMDVSASGGDASFTFTNTGGLQSVITDIYFDWGLSPYYPLYFKNFSTTGQVNYKVGGGPVLPGGNAISFVVDWGSEPTKPEDVQNGGHMPWGINNYLGSGLQDSLTIVFTGAAGSTGDQILSGLVEGKLEIGVHVQSLSDGKSESYVAPPTVPEPTTMLLLGLGLVGLAGLARRFKR